MVTIREKNEKRNSMEIDPNEIKALPPVAHVGFEIFYYNPDDMKLLTEQLYTKKKDLREPNSDVIEEEEEKDYESDSFQENLWHNKRNSPFVVADEGLGDSYRIHKTNPKNVSDESLNSEVSESFNKQNTQAESYHIGLKNCEILDYYENEITREAFELSYHIY